MIGALFGTAGALIGTKIADFFMNKGYKTVIFASIFVAIFALSPADIRLPFALFEVLVSENVMTLLHTLSLFFPMNFMLTCLIFILLCRHLESIYTIIHIVATSLVEVFVK